MLTPADRAIREDMEKIAADANAWAAENHALGGVCDFCATPIAGLEVVTFVAGSTVLSTMQAIDLDTGGVGAVTLVDDPYWAACPGCTVAVELDQDGGRLADYVMEHRNAERIGAVPEHMLVSLRDDLAQLYGLLYKSGLHRGEAPSS